MEAKKSWPHGLELGLAVWVRNPEGPERNVIPQKNNREAKEGSQSQKQETAHLGRHTWEEARGRKSRRSGTELRRIGNGWRSGVGGQNKAKPFGTNSGKQGYQEFPPCGSGASRKRTHLANSY